MTILHTVLSCSPSAAPSSSPPAAHGDSPCPLSPPGPSHEKRKRVGKKEREKDRRRKTQRE